MSSPVSHPQLEVAKLCSNCQNVQFRDDIPQLYQSGPHLDLDRERLCGYRRGWRNRGFLPTEFALTDSYPDLPELGKSSQDGCDFCKFLYEIFASLVSKDLHINRIAGCTMSISISYTWGMLNFYGADELEESYELSSGLDAMVIDARFLSDEIGDDGVTLEVSCHVESAFDSDEVSHWLRLKNRSNQEYCDAASVRWMKQALETCEKSHSHDIFDHTYIPERIIDVRPELPRLTLRSDHIQSHYASTLKYAALSYCWGSGENQAKTNVATLSDRQAGINETELPRVIREAIQVTRALEIPFLWVDALCILQDDPSDWERQCSQMHKIYGSAQVTLCAANSSSCDEGFLRQSGRIVRIPFQSHRAPDTKGSFLIQYKYLTDDFQRDIAFGSLYLDCATKLHRWCCRGWVFQEKVLSTRRLMFGACDLYFICDRISQHRGQDSVPGLFEIQIGKSDIEGDLNVIHETWSDLLTAYSDYDTDSFTNATDFLPALSGLAQLFHDHLKDDYYAGHWGRNLYKSLLWSKGAHEHDEIFRSAGSCKTRCEAFIVPSWSSLNKGGSDSIYSFGMHRWYDCRSEIKLIKGEALRAGANLFGALTGCSLRLQGYTLDLGCKEVDARASWPISTNVERHMRLLKVYGRRFGKLALDCKPNLHDEGGKCVLKGEFGQFKLLLLMRCDYLVSEAMPTNSDSEEKSIDDGEFSSEEDSSSAENYNRHREYSSELAADQQHNKLKSVDSREHSGRQDSDQMSGEEASAPSDDGSDDSQNQQSRRSTAPPSISWKPGDIVRSGYGLIICPTGNDGEFYRVGMFSPLDNSGGDIQELQSLAQVETVQLV